MVIWNKLKNSKKKSAKWQIPTTHFIPFPHISIVIIIIAYNIIIELICPKSLIKSKKDCLRVYQFVLTFRKIDPIMTIYWPIYSMMHFISFSHIIIVTHTRHITTFLQIMVGVYKIMLGVYKIMFGIHTAIRNILNVILCLE